MNDFREVLGARMSTGMRQKVSIARAIIHDPPVMIFDEPTLGLDVLVARAVIETVEVLRAQGSAFFFSTHIICEVEKLCDRVAIVARGRVQAMEDARRAPRPAWRTRVWRSCSSGSSK